MGDGMRCVTTTERGVTQGDATTPNNRCVTTTTPKGGWGGGEAASPVHGEVTQVSETERTETMKTNDADRVHRILAKFTIKLAEYDVQPEDTLTGLLCSSFALAREMAENDNEAALEVCTDFLGALSENMKKVAIQ